MVANRGEIACRILRACKEAGHPTVAICAPNDAGSMFTEMADTVVMLKGERRGVRSSINADLGRPHT